MGYILKRLDIFGIPHSTEDAILAAILQGDPALLIGPPGTAKTEIIDCIGSALREHSRTKDPKEPDKWFTHQVYDTSKLNPEDLIGIPNPKSLVEGKMDFIRLPSSIWDKSLVGFDEINRCEKGRQSALFEIIRSRRLNGIPTNNKFIFSAMNPLGDTGTCEMSEALTDRHMFYIWFDSFSDMAEDDKIKIINRVGQHEAVGFRVWSQRKYLLDINEDTPNKNLAEVGKDLEAVMTMSSNIYNQLVSDSKVVSAVSKLVVRIAEAIKKFTSEEKKSPQLDITGRRASMMGRGLLSIRAIQLAKGNLFNLEVPTLESALINGALLSTPIGISQKVPADTMVAIRKIIKDTIVIQYPVLFSNNSNTDKIYSIFYDKNPLTRLNSLLSIEDIPTVTKTKLWSDLYQETKDTQLESILYMLKQNIVGVVPDHIELNPEILKKDLETQNTILDKRFKPFGNQIMALQDKCKNNQIVQYCVSRSVLFLKDRKDLSDDQTLLLQNILNIETLADTLLTKLGAMMKPTP